MPTEPVNHEAASAPMLSPAQAQAIYTSMRILSAVSARVSVSIGDLFVREMPGGTVLLRNFGRNTSEQHASQEAFALAYGLQEG